MSWNRNFITQAIAEPSKNIFVFLLFGTYILSLATDAFTSLILENFATWFENSWGISDVTFRIIVVMSITLILFFLIAVTNISAFIARRLTPPTTIEPKPLGTTTLKGLIVFASQVNNQDEHETITSAEAAIAHHWENGKGELEQCWIICGKAELIDDSIKWLKEKFQLNIEESTANKYQLTYAKDPKRKLMVSFETMNQAEVRDPIKSFSLIDRIYQNVEREGIEKEDMIADFTGGTKSMTAGMILACANPSRRLQFMCPTEYTADGRADTSKPSIATEVSIDFKIKRVKKIR